MRCPPLIRTTIKETKMAKAKLDQFLAGMGMVALILLAGIALNRFGVLG